LSRHRATVSHSHLASHRFVRLQLRSVVTDSHL
jgi:hypothetical protein